MSEIDLSPIHDEVWRAPLMRMVFRLRDSGIEPSHVVLPMPESGMPPVDYENATFLGVPVVWRVSITEPYVSVAVGP